MRHTWLAMLCGIILFVLPTLARADCTEDPRKVVLDKDTTVRLKSFLCSSGEGPDKVEVRVEFHRFAEIAASLIVSKASSTSLQKTIGSPKLVENEVFKNYADLLKQFGTASDSPRKVPFPTSTSFVLGAAGQDASETVDDVIGADKVKTFNGLYSLATPFAYPAVAEIKSLKAKIIPDNLQYYFGINCDAEADKSSSTTCNKITSTNQLFWRGMQSGDLTNYGKNIKAYNQMLRQVRQDPINDAVPAYLKLTQYLAGQDWPADFLIMSGYFHTDSCGEGDAPGVAGWDFQVWPRKSSMEAVLIENVSKSSLRIGGLLGSRLSEPRLRVAAASAPSSTDALGTMSENLAPGQKLLIPVKIGFAPNGYLDENFAYPQSAADTHKRLGANGFKGNTAGFGAPDSKNYVFGTEFTVGGLVANDKQIVLSERPANFLDMAVAMLEGSCPYLLSWDGVGGDWIDHGKILHEAKGKKSEYSETVTLQGYRGRFRIEEREPEVALIDQAGMVVVLKNGETIALKPNNRHLTDRDGDYLQLLWGDAVEIEFSLPASVPAQDVAETRLTVTGYYQRYAEMFATSNPAPTGPVQKASYTPIPVQAVTSIQIRPAP
jgi:hypothetical protein